MNTGAVLGWEFKHFPGIETRDNKITKWPDALGPMPTQAEIDGFAVGYEKFEKERISIIERVEKNVKDRERKEAVKQLKLEGKNFDHFDNDGERI